MKEKLLNILKYCITNKTKIITCITSITVLISELVAVANGTTIGAMAISVLTGGN